MLGLDNSAATDRFIPVGRGGVIWLQERPADLTTSREGAEKIVSLAKLASQKAGQKWRETNYLLLQRGPCIIASGLDEPMTDEPHALQGRFVNLFDASLSVTNEVSIVPRSRWFLLDLDAAQTGNTHLLASACRSVLKAQTAHQITFNVEGVGNTPAIALLESPKAPRDVILDGDKLTTFEYSAGERLLWIHFENNAAPRELTVEY
jgi:hypothetical protein